MKSKNRLFNIIKTFNEEICKFNLDKYLIYYIITSSMVIYLQKIVKLHAQIEDVNGSVLVRMITFRLSCDL